MCRLAFFPPGMRDSRSVAFERSRFNLVRLFNIVRLQPHEIESRETIVSRDCISTFENIRQPSIELCYTRVVLHERTTAHRRATAPLRRRAAGRRRDHRHLATLLPAPRRAAFASACGDCCGAVWKEMQLRPCAARRRGLVQCACDDVGEACVYVPNLDKNWLGPRSRCRYGTRDTADR